MGSYLKNDSQSTVAELKDAVREFCEKRDWDRYHNAKDLAIGIITEASELLEFFRFKDDAEIRLLMNDNEKLKEISHELADIFYFILRFSQKYGIDITESFEAKMKVNEVKYPVDKAWGSNKKYNEF
ncbi:MAG: nucleotide pyrophosphohydrolase [Candidatus Acidulodesulfobacterium ferriphilum]|jgi:NTP pyrophosphatase (non-canonical NTP hydrolase)|uniref:Nucleotide pyrophosphohydrolase n=1 Tax=Candidatus Acidulodesulfobacterium ferriphilum TaxID=2597223 RepID=A0A519BA60_9DELT|nr:MAG: nucleotide pyrophosphohydrolase [Candidatus Acidulodesulfobacterium ferriphilum]